MLRWWRRTQRIEPPLCSCSAMFLAASPCDKSSYQSPPHGGMARPPPQHSSGAGTFARLANRVRLAVRRTRTGYPDDGLDRSSWRLHSPGLQAGKPVPPCVPVRLYYNISWTGAGLPGQRRRGHTLLLLSPVENPRRHIRTWNGIELSSPRLQERSFSILFVTIGVSRRRAFVGIWNIASIHGPMQPAGF